nr:hypothetical protein [Tanacetum cinerariifolium]
MEELRFLHVDCTYVSEDEVSNWSFDEVDLHLPNALRFLSWLGYPFSSLPKTFQPKNLVGLEMELGNLVQLWKDGEEKVFYKLRFLKFMDSNLTTLDLGITPNLETLSLDNCTDMVELKTPAEYIKTLPDSICMLKHLKSLKLASCLLLEKLTVDIGRLECLESLILSNCTLLQDLPNSIHEMKCLKSLELTYCIQVEKLPEAIGRLDCLKELNILGSGISHLPHSLYGLRGLRIIGDRRLLESCGLTPKRRRMSDKDSAFDDEMVCDI